MRTMTLRAVVVVACVVMMMPSLDVVEAASGGYLSSYFGPPNPPSHHVGDDQAPGTGQILGANGPTFENGTTAYANEVAGTAPVGVRTSVSNPQGTKPVLGISTIFNESFDACDAGALPAGWTEELLDASPTAWHSQCYSPTRFAAGQPTGVPPETGTGALTIETPGQGYPPNLDARVVSPPIDLRNVAGASVDSNLPTSEDPCTDVQAFGLPNSACAGSFASLSLHGELAQLEAQVGSELSTASGDKNIPEYSNVSDLPGASSAYGFGLVNLSFWHYWDFEPNDGGVVEVRWQRQDGSWSDWTSLQGDTIMQTNVTWPDIIQEAGCKPWVGLENDALTKSAISNAQFEFSPTEPWGSAFLCDTYDWTNIIGIGIGGNFLGADTPYGINPNWESPQLSLAALYANVIAGQHTVGPNGRMSAGGTQGCSYLNEPCPQSQPNNTFASGANGPAEAAYVGTSGGQWVQSEYTLNRFIGTKIQLGFRAIDFDQYAAKKRGWYVDDVKVTALLPSVDVGVANITEPAQGQVLATQGTAIRPQAVVENYGREEAQRINVTFNILRASDRARMWTGWEANRDLSLGPLEQATVSSWSQWTNPPAGDYVVQVNTSIDPAVEPTGPKGVPETDVNHRNDELESPFGIRDVYRLAIETRPDPASVQSDIGVTKTGNLILHNLGNVPLVGNFQLRATELDPTTEAPTATFWIKNWTGVRAFPNATAAPGSGSNGTLYLPWSWPATYASNGTNLPATAYRLDTFFTPVPATQAVTVFTNASYVYIRSTPLDPYLTNWVPQPGSLYRTGTNSVAAESTGWTPTSYAYIYSGNPPYETTPPDPVRAPWAPDGATSVSPNVGMWEAIGNDGCVGQTCAETDLLHWYPLRKEFNADPGATFVDVNFTSEGHFGWWSGQADNVSRGILRIVPSSMNLTADYLDSLAEDHVNATGIPVTVAGQTITVLSDTVAADPACGVNATAPYYVESREVLVGGQIFNTTELRLDRPSSWITCEEREPLSAFGTPNLTVEWIFNTSLERFFTQQNQQDAAACPGGTAVCSRAGYAPDTLNQLASHAPVDPVNRWFIDNIDIRSEQVASEAASAAPQVSFVFYSRYDEGNATCTGALTGSYTVVAGQLPPAPPAYAFPYTNCVQVLAAGSPATPSVGIPAGSTVELKVTQSALRTTTEPPSCSGATYADDIINGNASTTTVTNVFKTGSGEPLCATVIVTTSEGSRTQASAGVPYEQATIGYWSGTPTEQGNVNPTFTCSGSKQNSFTYTTDMGTNVPTASIPIPSAATTCVSFQSDGVHNQSLQSLSTAPGGSVTITLTDGNANTFRTGSVCSGDVLFSQTESANAPTAPPAAPSVAGVPTCFMLTVRDPATGHSVNESIGLGGLGCTVSAEGVCPTRSTFLPIGEQFLSDAEDGRNWTQMGCPIAPMNGTQYLAESLQYVQATNCRGWLILSPINEPLNVPWNPQAGSSTGNLYSAPFMLLPQYASNWYVEQIGSARVLRYGWLGDCPCRFSTSPYGDMTPDRDEPYGVAQNFDQVGCNGCSTPDSVANDGVLTSSSGARFAGENSLSNIAMSQLVSPPFTIAGLQHPVVTFPANYSFLRNPSPNSANAVNFSGANVHLIGLQQGKVLFRTLITPTQGYDDALEATPPTQGQAGVWPPAFASTLPSSDVCTLPAEPTTNLWAGLSGTALNPWVQETFDLAPYTTCGADQFELEFDVYNAWSYSTPTHGSFRVGTLRVADAVAANDLALSGIVAPPLTPAGSALVGPGVPQTIVANVLNTGVYNQSTYDVRIRIYEAASLHTSKPNLLYDAHSDITGDNLPGTVSGASDRNRTVEMPLLWTCPAEGTYVLTAAVSIPPGLGYSDSNPSNDVMNETIQCVALQRVGIPESVPDESIITPFVGGVGQARSVHVPIQNTGTLPIPQFSVNLSISLRTKDNTTEVVNTSAPLPVTALGPGALTQVDFPSVWIPNESGLYRVRVALDPPASVTGCTSGCTDAALLRLVDVPVQEALVPGLGQKWANEFTATGAWIQNGTRTGTNNSWTFGGPYGAFATGNLTLNNTLNALSLRDFVAVLNHRYDFESGVDGGLLEVSPDHGAHWYALPPEGGYPVNMSTDSPLVTDPNATVGAFSGQSNGWVTSQFDLGAVPQLTQTMTLVHSTFSASDTPFQSGIVCGAGSYSNGLGEDCAGLTLPPDGKPFYFADKNALLCNRGLELVFSTNNRVYNIWPGQIGSSTTDTAFKDAGGVTASVQFPVQFNFSNNTMSEPLAFNVWGATAHAGTSSSTGQPGMVSQFALTDPTKAPNGAAITNAFGTFPASMCEDAMVGIVRSAPVAWVGYDQHTYAGTLEWIMDYRDYTNNGTATGSNTMVDAFQSTKSLKVPLDASDLLAAQSKGTGLTVSYEDWRALGQTQVAYESVSSPGQPLATMHTAQIQVELVGVDSKGHQAQVPLLTPDQAASDPYRDWKTNSFHLDAGTLAPLTGAVAVYLQFDEIVYAGDPLERFSFTGPVIQNVEPGDSDWLSPTYGWAIAGIHVNSDSGVPLYSPTSAVQQSHSTQCLGETWSGQPGAHFPPAGIEPTPCEPTPWAVNDPNDESAVGGWLVNQSAEFGTKFQGDPYVWRDNTATGTIVAQPVAAPTTPAGVANALDSGMPGNDARLKIPIDLASATGNVTLSLETAYQFSMYWDPVRCQRNGILLAVCPYPQSGGRVEISTDGGTTWMPLTPKGAPLLTPIVVGDAQFNSPFGVDPQADSSFGAGGAYLAMDRGGASAVLQGNTAGNTIPLTFDLSKYAGKSVLLGFHVFFTTSRQAQGLPDTAALATQGHITTCGGDCGPDTWVIRNLTVTANTLVAQNLDFRLRGGADGTVNGQGWDLQNLQILGIRHTHDLAAVISPVAPAGILAQGQNTPVSVTVFNRAQQPAQNVVLTVTIVQTDPSAGNTLAQCPTAPGGVCVFSAPLNAGNFGPCSDTDSPIGAHAVMAPATDVHVCTFANNGTYTPMAFIPQASDSYRVYANVTDDFFAVDEIPSDNFAQAFVPAAEITTESRILIQSARASPNRYDPASKTDPANVSIAVTLVNHGALEATLGSLSLTIAGFNQSGPLLYKYADAKCVTGSASNTDPRTFVQPMETHTCWWNVSRSDLAKLQYGLASLDVVATTADLPNSARQDSLTLDVAPNAATNLGFIDHVNAPYPLTTQPTNPTAWYSANVHSACTPAPAPQQWQVVTDQQGGFFNHTPRFSFVEPSQVPAAVAKGVSGTAPPCEESQFVMDLRSPNIPMQAGGLARFVGPDGHIHINVTFWTRYQVLGNGYYEVMLVPDKLGDSTSLVQPNTPYQDGFEPIVWKVTSGESPQYAEGRFVPVTVDVGPAIERFVDPIGGAGSDVTHKIESGDFQSFTLNFQSFGFPKRAWQVDDVSVTPLAAAIGPSVHASATDDTEKVFRMVVDNTGAFTDSYAFNITDPYGSGSNVPADWHVTVTDSAGRILAFNTPRYQSPPPGCLAPSVAAAKFAHGLTLDPGQATQIKIDVCIPVSTQGARAGQTLLGITATSLSNPFANATAVVAFDWAYQNHPNMVAKASNIQVDNAQLPVGQPRTVRVTIQNTGPVDAADAEVRLVDGPVGVALPADTCGPLPAEFVDLVGVDGASFFGDFGHGQVIPSHGSFMYTFQWTPQNAGLHQLTVLADPCQKLLELSRDDNRASVVLNVTKAAWPDLAVALTVSPAETAVGTDVDVNLTVRNNGGAPAQAVAITLTAGITDLLTHSGTGENDFIPVLEPGNATVLHAVWHTLFPDTVHIAAGAIARAGVLERASTLSDNYALGTAVVLSRELGAQVANGNLSAPPGGVASLPVQVLNGGRSADQVVLGVHAPRGVIPEIFLNGSHVGSFPLGSKSNVTVTLNLTLPPTMAAGRYPVSFVVESAITKATTVVNLTLVVDPVYALSLTTFPASGGPGGNLVTMNVTNLGNARDPVNITSPNLPPGWALAPTTAVVAPYNTTPTQVLLTIPPGQPAGIVQLLLVGTDPSGARTNATLLVAVVHREIAQIAINAGQLTVARPGSALDLQAVVTNVGNVRLQGQLVVHAPAGWAATLSEGMVAADIGQSSAIPLTVVVPRGAATGTFGVTVGYVGATSNASTTAPIDIAESHIKVVDLAITPRVNIVPGTVVTINATVQDDGLPVNNLTVGLYLDDFLLGAEKITLGNGESTSLVFKWVAQDGEHVVLVLADPGNALGSQSDAQNARLQVLEVGSQAGILGATALPVPDVGSGLLVAAVGALALAAAGSRKARRKE